MDATTGTAATGLNARFFGSFLVTVDGQLINESSSRARRPWNLLQYLIVNRSKAVSRQQLIEALWPDGASEQPDKALKNLVYRVRSSFAAKGVPYAQDVILYTGGSYQLNNALPWTMDFEAFEALCTKALAPDISPEESVRCGTEAIALYEGDFLAEQVFEDWVLPYNSYYRSMFFKCVGHMLTLLEELHRDEEIENVCNRALKIDQFEEHLHLAYMKALVRQDKRSTALSHYSRLADMFFREMGVAPCDELRDLYQELSQTLNTAETDLRSIKANLSEPDVSNDAFYCDFEVFRNLYRLEARAAERAGQAVFVGLLTLTDQDGQPVPESPELAKSMAALLGAIHASLRRGDVVSRYSPSQYILMLPTITVENAEMVLSRVTERFHRNNKNDLLDIQARIQPLDPVMM